MGYYKQHPHTDLELQDVRRSILSGWLVSWVSFKPSTSGVSTRVLVLRFSVEDVVADSFELLLDIVRDQPCLLSLRCGKHLQKVGESAVLYS